MLWKKREEANRQLVRMNGLLKISFANVKRDTANIFKWLNYLYRKNMEQEQMIKQLQMEITYMPKTREEIRHIVDDYYSFENLMSKIRELNMKVDELSKIQETRQQPQQIVKLQSEAPKEAIIDFLSIEKRLDKLEQKKASVKERILRRITRNSKEYAKGIILSYIKKYERISALHLKEIVVDEQNLCSKSSFYRLLEEIEQLEDIGIIREGKEKHYLYKAQSPHQSSK